jgi:hypothetical protein
MVAAYSNPAQPPRPPAEWYGLDDATTAEPWLYDQSGSPLVISEEWIGFRVRFIPLGSRGMGETLVDELTGRPVLVARGSGPEEFCELVKWRPGRYRFAAINDRYQFVEGARVGIFVITPAMAAAAAANGNTASSLPAPMASSGEAITLVVLDKLSAFFAERERTLSGIVNEALGVIKAQSSEGARGQSELVRATATVVQAADGAGISRRDPLPPISPVVPASSAAPTDAPPGGGDGFAPGVGEMLLAAVNQLGAPLLQMLASKLFGLSPEMTAAIMSAATQGAAAAQNAAAQSAAAAQPPPASNTASGASSAPPPSSGDAPPTSPSPSTPPPTAETSKPSAGAAPLTAFLARFGAVGALLTPQERAVVHHLMSTMPKEDLVPWRDQLMALSVPDAAAWIRSVIAAVPSS